MNDRSPMLRPPTPDIISGFVRLQRLMYGWKQETLAAQAGVSLSTVQRVERGETVRPEALDRLAIALKHNPGAFTTPRKRLSDEEVAVNFREFLNDLAGTVPVPVAPLRTERQLRQLTSTELALCTTDIEEAERDLADFQEWMDLTAFVRASDGIVLKPKPERSFKMRTLYRDVLSFVMEIERRHNAVCLVGTYTAKSNMKGFETIEMGVVAIRSKANNPAAMRIRQLLGPEDVDARAAFQSYFAVGD